MVSFSHDARPTASPAHARSGVWDPKLSRITSVTSGASTLFLGAGLIRQRPRTFGASRCISIGRFGRGDDQQHGFGATLSVYGDAEARDMVRALVTTRNPRSYPICCCTIARGAPGIKYKSALGVVYGAGLHLKVDDIDSTRMLIRVEQGKGCTFVLSVNSWEFKLNGSSN